VNETIVLLVLLWAVVLVPGAIRARNRTSPHATVGGFERAMDVLRSKPNVGREYLVPRDAGRIVTRDVNRDEPVGPYRREDPVTARRRTWFVRLLAGTGATFLLAVAFGGWLWLPFVLVGLVAGGYTALLRHLKIQRDEARRVVREIDLRDRARAVADERHEPRGHEEPVAAASGGAVRLRRWDA
jgi:hypothetical protein